MTRPAITAAIATARDVYESVPLAGEVLDYLQAVLQVEAESREAIEWRERALKAEAALAEHTIGNVSAHTSGDTRFGPVVGGASATFDQAAAKMAAESARMIADAERTAALAGHVGTTNQPQTRMDAGVEGGQLGDLKAFVEEVNAGAAAWAMPAPAQTVDLVLKIDTSAVEVALLKVQQLKAALAEVSPVKL